MEYSNYITLNKNIRGVYDIDTTKGCYNGILNNKNGCYGECYANRYAKIYGFNFNKTTLREFKDINHIQSIREQIFNIDMPFIRIGVNGDPSENWDHCIKIINLIYGIKPIIIITKHWNKLTFCQLKKIEKFDLIINTSASALDNSIHLKHRINQYNIIKNHCKSVLRVVSCDFNKSNLIGLFLNEIQENLFLNENVLDNVLRVSKNNYYVKNEIINTSIEMFLTSKSLFSKKNKSTHTGFCKNCKDMCGLNFFNKCKTKRFNS